MSKEGVFEFYRDRLSACPSYGFKAGHEILELVLRCAGCDSSLTAEEYNSIIKQADLCHIKLMEGNYNDGWSK